MRIKIDPKCDSFIRALDILSYILSYSPLRVDFKSSFKFLISCCFVELLQVSSFLSLSLGEKSTPVGRLALNALNHTVTQRLHPCTTLLA